MAKLLSNLFPNNLKLFLKYNLDLLDGNCYQTKKNISHQKSVDQSVEESVSFTIACISSLIIPIMFDFIIQIVFIPFESSSCHPNLQRLFFHQIDFDLWSQKRRIVTLEIC